MTDQLTKRYMTKQEAQIYIDKISHNRLSYAELIELAFILGDYARLSKFQEEPGCPPECL